MKSTAKTLSTVSFVALLAIAWFLLAPPQLGGKTSYAVIYGISMEPRFHSGDLVLLRQEPSYHVGEIVGYHSQKLGRPVMHRIIKIDAGGHYWFKGDNNNFVDPEQPLASQLFGREWIRLPGVGAKLEQLHEPRNAAILGGLAALFILGGGTARSRRRRRRSLHDAPRLAPPGFAGPAPGGNGHLLATRPVLGAPAPASPVDRANGNAGTDGSSSSSSGRRALMPLGLGIGGIGVAGLVVTCLVAIVAYTRPLATLVTETNLYVQNGHFAYSADVPLGAVYDHSPLRDGDAIFTSIVHDFDITFRYRFSTDEKANVSGDARLAAVLTDGQGWTRTLPLVPTQQFKGSSTTLNGYVDLDALGAEIARFEKATDSRNDDYKLQVTPHVTIHGVVGDQLVNDVFTPTLIFDYSQGRLRPATSSDGATSNGFTRTRSGTGTSQHERKIGAMGVATARRAALIGVPASIALALLGGLLYLFARGNDEVALIRRRYGAWLIDVAAAQRPHHVERRVESMDALARIAERYERLILHEQRDKLHSFLVEDDGLVYRYDAHEKAPWRFERGQATRPASTEAAPTAAATPGATDQE